jgi:uncharacterized protein (DUF1697 family)
MTRYVAFLRAINVGGHTVKMDRLRELFQSMAFRNVETFIASGNVIFDALSGDTAALERRVERDLGKALGYEVGTFIRSVDEVAAVAAHQPFGDHETLTGQVVSVVFLKNRPDPAFRRKIDALNGAADGFLVRGREVYWLCRGGRTSESPAGLPFGKVIGSGGTMRNATTVRKLAARHASASAGTRAPR